MVTPDEIARVKVFAGLDGQSREHLARVAADISLLPGEFAAHEGDERALYAVLEGRIEAVKSADGVDKVVGERAARRHLRRGVDRRSARAYPGRVPRGRAVARGAPRGARLPRGRRRGAGDGRAGRQAGRGPHGRAARPAGHRGREPPPPRRRRVRRRARTPPCAQLRHFLERNQISYRWVAPDAPGRRGAVGRARCRTEGDCPVDPLRSNGKTVVQAPAAPRGRAPRAGHRGRRRRVRHRRSSAPARPASRPPCTAPPRGSGRSSSSARRPAARPAPPRASRTTSASPPASPATSWRAGPCSRPGGSARRSS